MYDNKDALVSWSASWDTSYEIVEFTGTPGKTYTVRIVRGEGEEQAYYGIAWSIRDLDFASAIAAGDLDFVLAEPYDVCRAHWKWPGSSRWEIAERGFAVPTPEEE